MYESLKQILILANSTRHCFFLLCKQYPSLMKSKPPRVAFQIRAHSEKEHIRSNQCHYIHVCTLAHVHDTIRGTRPKHKTTCPILSNPYQRPIHMRHDIRQLVERKSQGPSWMSWKLLWESSPTLDQSEVHATVLIRVERVKLMKRVPNSIQQGTEINMYNPLVAFLAGTSHLFFLLPKSSVTTSL